MVIKQSIKHITKPIKNSALRDATAHSQTVSSNLKKLIYILALLIVPINVNAQIDSLKSRLSFDADCNYMSSRKCLILIFYFPSYEYDSSKSLEEI